DAGGELPQLPAMPLTEIGHCEGKGTKQHLAEGFTVFCGPPTTLERPLLKAAV
ncbi:unnamed protein product, partial [Cladocopium goreaui]